MKIWNKKTEQPTNCPEMITDRNEFSSLREEVGKIIDTRKSLPDFVFKRSFARYFAIEYAHVYGPKFGMLLHQMSVVFRDESVSYMMLDPDPWDGTSFGLISFQSANLPTRYTEVMPPKGCSRILAGANLGVFWGSSLKWGVFADRISWELAVIAADQEVEVQGILGWPCFNAAKVQEYMMCQYRVVNPSGSVASEFSRRLSANYSI